MTTPLGSMIKDAGITKNPEVIETYIETIVKLIGICSELEGKAGHRFAFDQLKKRIREAGEIWDEGLGEGACDVGLFVVTLWYLNRYVE